MAPAWIALVVTAGLATLLLNMRRPANVAIRVERDHLVVALRGWDAIYCCRRRVEAPLSEIEGVGLYARDRVPVEGPRLPGASFPGVIRAGSFGVGDRRDFWDVRRGQQVLVVQMKPGAEFRRLVLEVPEPQEKLAQLRPLLGALDWTPAAT